MKMYIPFGDWSDDGHGKYERILVEAPSMEYLLNAQSRIKAIYGQDFFNGFARDYDEPYLSPIIWQALKETNYPVEDSIEFLDEVDPAKLFESDYNPAVTLDFVVDSFIWLLNAYGGEVTQLDKRDDIPMICNWTCHGFETVGYGCFW